MKPPMVSREDAREIAEACVALADKALSWKARALAAEEALRRFAGEIYGHPSPDQSGAA